MLYHYWIGLIAFNIGLIHLFLHMVFNIVEVLKFKPLISHSSSPQRTGNLFPWWLVIHSKERAGDQIAIVNMILVGYNSGYNTNNSDYEYGYLMALYI